MYRPLLSQLGRRASVPVSGAIAGTVQQQQAQNSAQHKVQSTPIVEEGNKQALFEDDSFQILNKEDIIEATQVVTNYTENQGQEKTLEDSSLDQRANSQMQDLNEQNRRESIKFLLQAGSSMAQNDNIRRTILKELANDAKLRESIMGVQGLIDNYETPQIEYQQEESQDVVPYQQMLQKDDSYDFAESFRDNIFEIAFNIHKQYVKVSSWIKQLFAKLATYITGVGTKVRHNTIGGKVDPKEEGNSKRKDFAIGVITVVATAIICVGVLRKGAPFLAKLFSKRR